MCSEFLGKSRFFQAGKRRQEKPHSEGGLKGKKKVKKKHRVGKQGDRARQNKKKKKRKKGY